MGIAENIKRLRTQSNWTQEQLAEKVGVTRSTVTQWETGWSQPRMGAVGRIASAFGVSVTDIVSEENHIPGAIPIKASRHATVPLRRVGKVHAGSLEDEELLDGEVEVPADVAEAHPRAVAMLVEGDCMDELVPEGCHVLVDPTMTEPHDRSVVVVETEDFEATMREWRVVGQTLVLVARSHQSYEDMVFSDPERPVRVLGTVVWFQSAGQMK
jgi:repressor LexA